MDHWDIAALRAAASRERAQVVHELLARFAAWLRSVPTIRVPPVKGRECFGTDC
jgi:hypothetical protein